MENEKVGLVLEGGALRGIFTCGVLDVLMENGICLPMTVGVSAGAVFGSNYKSGQVGRALRYNLKFCKDRRYGTMRSLLKSGDLYDAEFCYDEIPNKLDIFDSKAFENNPMDFYSVVTNVETGRPEYHKCIKGGKEDLRWIRASASLPLGSNIVEIGNGRYLDGGISDSVPLKFAESIGFEKNIVILTQPMYYRKKRNPLMPIIRMKYKEYPKFVKAMERRHIMYNKETRYVRMQEKAGKVLIILPEQKLNISRMEHSRKKIEAVYEYGAKMAVDNLESIKRFIGK